MESVNAYALRRNLADILNRVEYQKIRIQVIRHGKARALLVPIASEEVVSDPTAPLLAAAGAPAPAAKKSPGKSPKNPKKA